MGAIIHKTMPLAPEPFYKYDADVLPGKPLRSALRTMHGERRRHFGGTRVVNMLPDSGVFGIPAMEIMVNGAAIAAEQNVAFGASSLFVAALLAIDYRHEIVSLQDKATLQHSLRDFPSGNEQAELTAVVEDVTSRDGVGMNQLITPQMLLYSAAKVGEENISGMLERVNKSLSEILASSHS